MAVNTGIKAAFSSIWTVPVSGAELEGVTVVGAGTTFFSNFGAEVAGVGGRIIAAVLVSVSTPETVVFAGLSRM